MSAPFSWFFPGSNHEFSIFLISPLSHEFNVFFTSLRSFTVFFGFLRSFNHKFTVFFYFSVVSPMSSQFSWFFRSLNLEFNVFLTFLRSFTQDFTVFLISPHFRARVHRFLDFSVVSTMSSAFSWFLPSFNLELNVFFTSLRSFINEFTVFLISPKFQLWVQSFLDFSVVSTMSLTFAWLPSLVSTMSSPSWFLRTFNLEFNFLLTFNSSVSSVRCFIHEFTVFLTSLRSFNHEFSVFSIFLRIDLAMSSPLSWFLRSLNHEFNVFLAFYIYIYHITSIPSLQGLYARIRSGSWRLLVFQLTDPTLKKLWLMWRANCSTAL